MAGGSLLERIASTLFGGGPPSDKAGDAALVSEVVELVVETVEPRIRLHSRYARKLAPCVQVTIAHLREIARGQLDPVLLTRAAWNEDPRVNAFFATADDVNACLGRSRELRAFFADPANAGVQEAYALLAMKKAERKVFAPQLQGDMVRQDVAQVTVSFSDHRLVAPAATLSAARLEIGKRTIQRLAQVVLARIVALDMQATELREHKAYLAARLRMLHLARDGMEGLFEDPATIDAQIKAVERELSETLEDYMQTKGSLASLDAYIQQIDDVLSHPAQHVCLTQTPLRVSRTGFKVEGDFAGPVNELTLTELSIGDALRGAIAIVRCPRAEVPPEENRIAHAERYL